jgi:hypothetical protein
MFGGCFILSVSLIFFKKGLGLKSEVFTIFKQWKAQVKNQTERKVKHFGSDNELEYKDAEFLELCKIEDITRHFTIKETIT